ncbi:Hypothetical_protein [Hexamita inflata]|uniref:Hypothetical_protein n=1 Tax=Hexamita inflata TaxID=28002 RepID=A0ABP1HSK0_9EUKA
MERSRKSVGVLMPELKRTVSLGQYLGVTENIKEASINTLIAHSQVFSQMTEAEPESQDKLDKLRQIRATKYLSSPLDLATNEEFLKRIQNVALLKQQMKENKIN